MKIKMKKWIVWAALLVLMLGASGLMPIKAQAMEEDGKQYIPLNQEVAVDEGTYYIMLPSAGKVSLSADDIARLDLGNGTSCGFFHNELTSCRLPVGEYSIFLSHVPDGKVTIYFTEESPSSYEQEFNDTFDSANEITLNNLYYGSGNTYGSGDEDYYKFSMASSGSLYIEATSRLCLNFSLYSEDSNMNTSEIFSGYLYNNGCSEKVRVSPGVYYVLIKQAQDINENSEDYQFKVICNPESSDSYETEGNNTLEAANTMNPNVGYTGNVQNKGDVDYYKVTLPSDGKAKLRLETPRQTEDKLFKAELMKINEAGKLQTIDTVYSSTNPVMFGNEQMLDAGSYYVRVQKGKGDSDYYNVWTSEHTHIDYNIQCVFDEIVLVKDITISCDEDNLMTGDTATLTATVTPENANSKSLQWTSSDKQVVKVDQDGNITCIAPGQAIITARANDGSNAYGELRIVVNKRLVEEITVTLSEETVSVGDEVEAEAVVSPEDADEISVKWESSNPQVAKVSSEGVVKALKNGKASIKAIAKDGSGVVGSATITVEKKKSSDAQLKKLSISKGKLDKTFSAKQTSYTLTLEANTASVKITPQASSKYATVKINGTKAKNITVKVAANKSKTVKITVIAEDGTKKTYTIKVVRKAATKKSTVSYTTYHNGRFGFKIKYPSFFKQSGDLPENGDGIAMAGKKATLLMYGSYATVYTNGKEMKKAHEEYGEKMSSVNATKTSLYYESKSANGQKITFHYSYFVDGGIISMELTCNQGDKAYYKKIVQTMMNSIKKNKTFN